MKIIDEIKNLFVILRYEGSDLGVQIATSDKNRFFVRMTRKNEVIIVNVTFIK